MEINQLLKKLKKLRPYEIEVLILTLLVDKDISFTQLTKVYVESLERAKKANRTKRIAEYNL